MFKAESKKTDDGRSKVLYSVVFFYFKTKKNKAYLYKEGTKLHN